MIHFTVISDLLLYVLDTRVKKQAEVSTDHHRVVIMEKRVLKRTLEPKNMSSGKASPISLAEVSQVVKMLKALVSVGLSWAIV